MKVLAVGGGSMGRRRLRDLVHLNEGEVILYEPQEKRCLEAAAAYGVRGVTDFDAAMAEKPEAMTISTPPAMHEKYVRAALDRGMHVFSELPFVFDADALAEIAEQAGSSRCVLGISCTIRYYPPMRLIHDLIQEGAVGRPLYLEYSLGNYLPDWHPYEDYRKFYASDAKLGGAGLDMILHELGPIQWWLGPIASVHGRLTKLSALEIAGPDNHDALITFRSGCRGYFHHDVIEQGTLGRHVRIAGDAGTLEWHQNLPAVRVFEGADQKAREVPFSEAGDWEEALDASSEISAVLARRAGESGKIPSANQASFVYESCYLREMKHFLDAAGGNIDYTASTIDEELQTVRAFQAIVRSSEEHREVDVP